MFDQRALASTLHVDTTKSRKAQVLANDRHYNTSSNITSHYTRKPTVRENINFYVKGRNILLFYYLCFVSYTEKTQLNDK
jgi:hypothetical protein